MKLAVSLLLSLLSLASPAAALDLCYVESGSGYFTILHRVKLPKRAYDSVPVTGIYNGGAGVFGTIYSNGSLFLQGFVGDCHVYAPFGLMLDLTVYYNCTPTGGGSSTVTWSRVDCDVDL
jgi:hypothetical protein